MASLRKRLIQRVLVRRLVIRLGFRIGWNRTGGGLLELLVRFFLRGANLHFLVVCCQLRMRKNVGMVVWGLVFFLGRRKMVSRPLGPLGYEGAQHRQTLRPSVDGTRSKALRPFGLQ